MKSILSTKKLTESQKAMLPKDVTLVEYDAIKISYHQITIPKIIENAIITSQNTVQAILDNNIKIQNCFCVGEKTKIMLEENGFKVIENTDYGQDLAEKITQSHKDKRFTFFCGSRRLDIIPEMLKKHSVSFEEIELYQVDFNPKKIERIFDGILFFSPSGVQSFVLENSIENVVCFCIGTTTANECRSVKFYGSNADKIVIAIKPTVENVIVEVINYFNEK